MVVHPASHRVSRVPWYSGSRPVGSAFRLQGFHLLRRTFPSPLARPDQLYAGPQPRQGFPRRFGLHPVSLAATQGISLDFFSSGYLDVSVPRVPFYV